MPNEALIAVLLGALLHASWNAAVKSRADKFLATVFVAIGGSIIAAVVLPFLPQPAPASWPYLAVSESCSSRTSSSCRSRIGAPT